MDNITIETAVKVLNPKALIVKTPEGETLFSYNAPVVHRNAEGTLYFDAFQWSRTKPTVGHVKAFVGEDREAITKKLLSGVYFLAVLKAPNMEAPASEEAAAQ